MRQAYTFVGKLLPTPYSVFGIVLLSLTIALSGCGEDASGGSSFTDVGRDEPTIVDSVLATDVLDDRPDGITTTFVIDVDDRVFLWMLWTNITKQHTVEVSWYSPDDDLDGTPSWSEEKTLTSTTGDKITWFYMDLPEDTGYWLVKIYLDGLFERSHWFQVE
ncbi:MAG: hypothetical protein OYL97_02400 [Candidatus Poribacteria bacterium]|nr:hypothetical protein [Candidatus Poribacteria bacterium]